MARPLLLPLLAAGLGGLLVLTRFGLFAPSAAPQGREPEGAVPVGPLLVLAAGTSLTARGDWTEELARRLTACRGAPVNVEKLARAGATSRWGEEELEARLAVGPRPDLVLIEFAINDAVLARAVSLAESRRRTAAMIEAARAAGALPLLVTMTPAHGIERLERPFLPAYRAQYAAIADATGAGLVDTWPAWEAQPRDALAQLIPDGVHPSGEAMAELLVPDLVRALAPLLCAPGRTAQ